MRQFIRDNSFAIIMIVITSLFSSGVTYASMNGKIDNNAKAIDEIRVMQADDKADFKERLERIENKTDRIEGKIDNINNYLIERK